MNLLTEDDQKGPDETAVEGSKELVENVSFCIRADIWCAAVTTLLEEGTTGVFGNSIVW